jgi:ubiquinone/menaquinone biosynthesis C-methylase UbiE
MNQPKEATRGNPSFVWRAGQERRLRMLNAAAPLADRRVLEFGCGLGMYMREMRRFTPHVFGFDVEIDRLIDGKRKGVVGEPSGMLAGVGEQLPFADNSFDVVFTNEVLEHVQDDAQAAREIARVLRPGGRSVNFVPNRLYFFETHGIYWQGKYQFGNKLFVNWLPDVLRNKLAPHVRAYTHAGIRHIFAGTPMQVVQHTQVYGGFDNLVARLGPAGKLLRSFWQGLEASPLRAFGLSHFIVLQKQR